jgi:uncharacterized membrane protein
LKTSPRTLLLGVAVALTVWGPRWHAGPLTFTSFNCHCVALGINDSGEVVGTTGQVDGDPNFLWTGSAFQTISVPQGWSYVTANGINDAGQIVGQYYADGTLNGFLDSGGVFTTINFPGAADSEAEHIDNAANILGLFDEGGSTFTLSDGVYTQVTADWPFELDTRGANDLGWIVGTTDNQGFLLVGSTLTVFDYPGASNTVATGVDDFGDIVGYYVDATGRHGFLDIGNTFTSITFPGASETDVYGVNNEGQLVGTAWTGTLQDEVASGFVADFTPGELPTPEAPSIWLTISGATLLFAIRRLR